MPGLNQGSRTRVTNSHLWEVRAVGTVEYVNGIGPCPVRVRFDDGTTNIYAQDELKEI